MKSKIYVALCGGTIEKTYNEVIERTKFNPLSNEVIQQLVTLHIRPQDLDIQFERVMQKDSLKMDDEDRKCVLEYCTKIPSDKIIITHGTSTMTKTADILMKDDRLKGKIIVITGAMRPYLLRGNTDAVANVASALTAVQILKPGVYIAMNGRIFEAGKVRKNEGNGWFEEA